MSADPTNAEKFAAYMSMQEGLSPGLRAKLSESGKVDRPEATPMQRYIAAAYAIPEGLAHMLQGDNERAMRSDAVKLGRLAKLDQQTIDAFMEVHGLHSDSREQAIALLAEELRSK